MSSKMIIGDKIREIKRIFNILSNSDKRKLLVIGLVQSALGILDLIGVALIGVIAALSISGGISESDTGRLRDFLNVIRINSFSFENQVAALGMLAVALFTIRTISSIFITRKILFFMSKRGAFISADLVSRLLSKPLLTIQNRTTQQTIYALTTGVESIVLQVIGAGVILLTDISLLLIILAGLFTVDVFASLGSLLIFGVVGFLLYKYMHNRARVLGEESSKYSILSSEKISEVLSTYRESMVRNRRSFYTREIQDIRFTFADLRAEMSFQPFVSKYIMEISVVVGALILSSLQLLFHDSTTAVATLAVFLTAGTRIAPAVLRVQQNLMQINAGIGQAIPTLELIDELGTDHVDIPSVISNDIDIRHEGFVPKVVLKNVNFKYSGQNVGSISDVSFNIDPGRFVAVVGPSGAGKTTLIDLILGVLHPDSGLIQISEGSPHRAIQEWPGAISYVPQDVSLINGSISENVSLGYPLDLVSKNAALIDDALRTSHLSSFLESLPLGIATQVGERGSQMSGGQRQRIGIARALFTQPKLLVLDEATSALDGETEMNISDAISNLKGRTTIIMIAHRLSTVRNADIVIYVDGGRIKSIGTFQEVRESVDDFDRQANLMGL